jgi:hypothetical protein
MSLARALAAGGFAAEARTVAAEAVAAAFATEQVSERVSTTELLKALETGR